MTEQKYDRKWINKLCDDLLDADSPLCRQASPLIKQLYECGVADQDRIAAMTQRAERAEAVVEKLRVNMSLTPTVDLDNYTHTDMETLDHSMNTLSGLIDEYFEAAIDAKGGRDG